MKKNFITLNKIKEADEFKKYYDFSTLGKAGNSIVFKAKHKILEQYVVIKVYAIFPNNIEIMREKHRKEIIKNASFRLTKSQSVIFDTGKLNIGNDEFLYSIMNFLDAITLKEWLELRKKWENSCGNKSSLLPKIEINAALGILYYYHILIQEKIIHGDLNKGNIMILKQEYNTDEFLKFTNIYGDYITPNNIEFIDYGTSKWSRTRKEIGIERDLEMIFNNIGEVISSYPIKEFIDFDYIFKSEDDFVKYYRMEYLIIDLIRVILSIDFLEDILTTNKNFEPFIDKYKNWLQKLWYDDFKWSENFEFNKFINLEYWKVLKKPSVGKLIKEENILNYFNKKSSNLKFEFDKKFEKIGIHYFK